RVKGIEPSSQAWEARILPLNHTRLRGQVAPARQARLDININSGLSGRSPQGEDRRGKPALNLDCFYQTARRLATGVQNNHGAISSRWIALRNRSSIKSCRSTDTTLLPSSSRT